jgi:hypothetical protein
VERLFAREVNVVTMDRTAPPKFESYQCYHTGKISPLQGRWDTLADGVASRNLVGVAPWPERGAATNTMTATAPIPPGSCRSRDYVVRARRTLMGAFP